MSFLSLSQRGLLLASLFAVTFLSAQEKKAEKTSAQAQEKKAEQTPEQKKDQEAKALADNAQAAAGLTESQGKDAVIRRIRALFTSSTKPVISTKKFVPAEPFLSITDVPQTDKLIPPKSIIVYRFRFINVKKAQSAIEAAVADAGTCDIAEPQNSIIIYIQRDKVPAVKATLLALDQPLPQVLVETQIIEVLVKQGEERDVSATYTHYDADTNTTSSYGYSLQSPTQNRTSETSGFNFFPYLSGTEGSGNVSKLNLLMRWLTTSSDAKILASPNVIADLGTVASIITGEELPYTENAVTTSAVSQSFKFKRTGVKLNITPELINPDTVQLTINPEITTVVRYQQFTQQSASSDKADIVNSIPIVSVRNITTRLTAADGEIIMLGGLYSSEQSESLRKTPFLSDIPVLGEFFTAKDATTYDKQLVFFMKIHILQTPYAVTMDLEKSAQELKKTSDAIYNSGEIFTARPYPTLSQSLFPRDGKLDDNVKPRSFYSIFFGEDEDKKAEKEPEKKTQIKALKTTPVSEEK